MSFLISLLKKRHCAGTFRSYMRDVLELTEEDKAMGVLTCDTADRCEINVCLVVCGLEQVDGRSSNLSANLLLFYM